MCSSSTRTSSRDDIDQVDGARSSDDESDSDADDKEPINDIPVTFEYVYGTPSPALHYKLPKTAEPTASNGSTTTTISSQPPAPPTRKTTKSSKSAGAQSQSLTAKKHNSNSSSNSHHQQQQQRMTEELADATASDESATEVVSASQGRLVKLHSAIREFFDNRKNWSDGQKAFIICFGFMIFAVILGCILQYVVFNKS